MATLVRRVASICKAHEERGFASPTHSVVVRATMHGIRRIKGSAQRHALPVSMKDLNAMRRHFVGMQGVRDRALLLVGFAGAFRRSELVQIEIDDLAFSSKGVVIRMKRGKTDQEGKGRLVAVPYMKGMNCPVKALKEWIQKSGIECGVVFRQVDRNGCVKGQKLTGQTVSLIIKKRMAELGRDTRHYSGHSLRAGWVTSAAMLGVSSWRICQQTGHKSEITMHRYIRDGGLFSDYPRLAA